MDSSPKTFLITVNLSTLFEEENPHFTMLIDYSKMTIVYEFVEWLRWVFSINQCVYLTHNNSIIHDLEDIRILEILKNLQLKYCKSTKCIHNTAYKNLMDSLNFYALWNRVRVPKFFVNKMCEITKKFYSKGSITKQISENAHASHKEKFSVTEDCKVTKNLKEEISCLSLVTDNSESHIEDSYFDSKTETLESTKTNQNNCNFKWQEVIISDREDTGIKADANVKSFETKINTNSHRSLNIDEEEDADKLVLGTQNLSELNESSIDCRSQKVSKTPYNNGSCESLPKKNEKKFSNRHKKPFSVAEVLASLRQETEKQVDCNINNSPQERESKISNVDSSCDDQYNNFDDPYNLQISQTKKKRKRVRKNKARKLKIMMPEFVQTEKLSFCEKPSPNLYSSVKPNHIRFTNDSDDEENYKCENGTKTIEINEPKSNFKPLEISEKNKEINLENVMSVINEKKRLLSSHHLDNLTSNNEASIDQNYKEQSVQENLTFSDSPKIESVKTCYIEGESDNQNNFDLESLKYKFPFPVVFERKFSKS